MHNLCKLAAPRSHSSLSASNVQYYTNGDSGGGCPHPRTSTVTYQCNAALSSDKAIYFGEPSICNYAVTIQTPRVWLVSCDACCPGLGSTRHSMRRARNNSSCAHALLRPPLPLWQLMPIPASTASKPPITSISTTAAKVLLFSNCIQKGGGGGGASNHGT